LFEEGLHHLENKVKLARIQVSLTQQQLAEKIGVTRQTISLIEKGKYNPTLKLCLDICYAVNKTLDEVFWIEQGSEGK
jgi:putative transcriptional regulator